MLFQHLDKCWKVKISSISLLLSTCKGFYMLEVYVRQDATLPQVTVALILHLKGLSWSLRLWLRYPCHWIIHRAKIVSCLCNAVNKSHRSLRKEAIIMPFEPKSQSLLANWRQEGNWWHSSRPILCLALPVWPTLFLASYSSLPLLNWQWRVRQTMWGTPECPLQTSNLQLPEFSNWIKENCLAQSVDLLQADGARLPRIAQARCPRRLLPAKATLHAERLQPKILSSIRKAR